ncbi:hypothetical protein [Oceanobacillus sp. CF4.6]|uniref:hypothetical protein n=1 Tax=Oceanobacillus sp. CF4.6 TaxID=3373080 RepID=UPI003EE6F7C2
MIGRIYSDKSSYAVGTNEVECIELTNHGNKNTTVYKITRTDSSFLYAGMLEHEVENRLDVNAE